MKLKNLYALFLMGCTVLFSMCTDLKIGADFLDKAPDGGMNIDSVFSSRITAERAVTNAYIALPYGIPYGWAGYQDKLGMDILESITDLCQSYMGWGNEADYNYYNGHYDPAGTLHRSKYSYLEEHCWESVRAAYIVIENIDKVPDMDQELKDRRKAEMKMVIAVHYTDMFRHYGGLPLLDKAIYPGDDYKYPRETVENTVKFITRLCDEAAPDLPWSVSGEDDGRFTRAAAMATKVRVLLFAASPLYNDSQPFLDGAASSQHMTWYGDYQESRWQDVVDACEEFFVENGKNTPYQLVQTGDYRQDYQDSWFKRGNGEVIVSTRIGYKLNDIWDGNLYFYQSSGWYGCACATLNYVDMFPMADGSPCNVDWENPPVFDWSKPETNPFYDRDPRMYENLVILGDTWRGRRIETWVGGQDQVSLSTGITTGTKMRKFLLEHDDATLRGSVMHWPWLRLAEVYLSYAEALNEVGRTGEAYAWLEKTRARVGLKPLGQNLDKIGFRKAVLQERTLEFGWEEVRWFDLVRWKMADEFKKTLYMLEITNKDGQISFKRKAIKDRYWKTDFSPKWYLSAFPVDEVQKGMVQNPGW